MAIYIETPDGTIIDCDKADEAVDIMRATGILERWANAALAQAAEAHVARIAEKVTEKTAPKTVTAVATTQAIAKSGAKEGKGRESARTQSVRDDIRHRGPVTRDAVRSFLGLTAHQVGSAVAYLRGAGEITELADGRIVAKGK